MWIGIIKEVKNHTVDLSDYYLKEGAKVFISNDPKNVVGFYERWLPNEEYWAYYTANPEVENPSDVSPHDIIYITKEKGECKVFIDTDDQERECAEKDRGKK